MNAVKSNLAGIAHVISRMDWYCALAEDLLGDDCIEVGGKSSQAVKQCLEDRVLTLYKSLLLYQMKSVCAYYKHQGLVFLRNLVIWDDWDADLKAVTDAEALLQGDLDQYGKQHTKHSLTELIKSSQGMEGQLQGITQEIRELIAENKAMQTDKKDEQCLQDLFVVDPQDDMDKIEKSKDNLLRQAYKWILSTDEFAALTNWGNSGPSSPPGRVLWIQGHAGTGKTMLLIGVVRELSSYSARLAPNVAQFFFQGTDQKLNTATAALRSLVWLLLVQQPHLMPHLRSKHKHAGSALFKGDGALISLSNAFKGMLTDPVLCPVYFVLDALDECEQGLDQMVQLISESLALTNKVKWLVSSRPTIQLKTPELAGSLIELDPQRLQDPVNEYIGHRMSTLTDREGYDDLILAEIEREVRRKAENTFLWVALMFKELDAGYESLNPVHGAYALEIVRNIPSGLSKVYDHIMKRIEAGVWKDPTYCKAVLMAVYLAFRPLDLSELAILADIPLKMSPRSIVQKCGSFLTIKKDTVFLVHQSAKDYLDVSYRSRLDSGGPAKGHTEISRRSIKSLSSMLKQNVWKLSPGLKPKHTSPPDPDPLAPIRYACVHWVDHLSFPNHESPDQTGELIKEALTFGFLNTRFLRWLEALSLLGQLSCGVQSIRTLLDLARFQMSQNSQLTEFLKDAERFLLGHGSIIERAPLQVYASALIFSPILSHVRRDQWEERLPFIQAVSGIKGQWGADRQTLEGHSDWVMAIAFSSDGKMLASASYDTTVRLWNAATGAHQQTLVGHRRSVRAVAFSPDSNMLASASSDNTIRLWNNTTGAIHRVIHGHTNSIHSVAFSADGKILASASSDHTIRLWDAITGLPQKVFKGHDRWITAVTFSSDGKILASASFDHTIRLWDARTGVLCHILDRHSKPVMGICFSPDGKKIASASEDTCVSVWDTTTGQLEHTLHGHTNLVKSVAFSPDGKKIASASYDKTIRLWDMQTAVTYQVLEEHRGCVSAIAFSPDGKTLSSASYDGTVRLWEMAENPLEFDTDGYFTSQAPPSTLQQERSLVGIVTFSMDGSMLASASSDRTIRLWDPKTGVLQQTFSDPDLQASILVFSPDGKILASVLSGHTILLWNIPNRALQSEFRTCGYNVKAVTFSPDGKMIASATDTGIDIWNVETVSRQQTIQTWLRLVRGAAFSADSKTLASASSDGTVQLWDVATGTLQRTLVGHRGPVRAISFSQDSKTLVSASLDGSARLWDTATGALKMTLQIQSRLINEVAFSEDGKHLKTNSGVFRLCSQPTAPDNRLEETSPDESLLIGNEWIRLAGDNHLWLPMDYRATCIALYGNIAVLGHRSGRLTFLQLGDPLGSTHTR
ncbi:unnamed protein product [Penicillium salamii]|uniref:Mitochondrial division protein 1 n=1 Tax=Penicillium salamii TaxID=1612424 RepID=A0A9W4IZ37_9EURO|nr:unnamed protein product [Penicillium salamii]